MARLKDLRQPDGGGDETVPLADLAARLQPGGG
jgi:hypothetical protein